MGARLFDLAVCDGNVAILAKGGIYRTCDCDQVRTASLYVVNQADDFLGRSAVRQCHNHIAPL